MVFIVSTILFILFHFNKASSECESNAKLWTYYPCSFIISSSSFDCPYLSINSSIDQCTNREMTFFWHFPSGNMTLTLQSEKNQPFLLRLSKILLSKHRLIKNVYHLVNNKSFEERLIYDNGGAIIILHSDKYNQCSLKFETSNGNIFDYGTFIQMTVSTNEGNDL